MGEQWAKLRTLLAKAPSSRLWKDICDHIDTIDDRHLCESTISYVNAHLSGWPLSMRIVLLRPDWQSRYFPTPPSWKIARSVVLDDTTYPLLQREFSHIQNDHAFDHIERMRCSLVGAALEPAVHRIKRILPQLRSLDLSGPIRSPNEIHSLFHASWLDSLEELQLGHCGIGDEGCKLLSSASFFPSLSALSLENNQVSGDGLHALLSVSECPPLRTLNLSTNVLHEDVLQELSSLRETLHTLSLSANPLAEDAHVFLCDTHMSFEGLFLDFLSITEDGLGTLLSSDCLKGCCSFGLSGTGLDDRGFSLLAGSPSLRMLQELSVARNEIGDSGLIALSNTKFLTNLRSLELSANQIGDDGLVALASSEAMKHLHTLKLSFNRFRARGMMALSRSPHLTQLRTLDVRGVKI